jgi:hypothetical protein
MGQKLASGYTTGGIGCLGGVSTPCRLATPAVSPISKSGKWNNLLVKISQLRTA